MKNSPYWDNFNRINNNYEESNFTLALTNKNFCLNQIIDSGDESKDHATLEQRAITLFLGIFHYLSSIDTPEKIEALNNEVTTFAQDNQNDIDYYKERFDESDNEFDKIRYGYITWLLKKNYAVFQKTLDYTVNFLQRLINENRGLHDIIDLLCFTYNIMLLYASKNESIKRLINTSCRNLIERVKSEPDMYRYLVEPILILVKLEKNDELTNRMISTLHGSAKELQSNLREKFSVSEGLLRASMELVDYLSSISGEEKKKLKNSIFVMLGDLHKSVAIDKLKQGDKNSLVVASIFYKEAADEYKMGEDNTKHKEMLKLSSENADLGDPIETKLEFPDTQISGETEYERLRNLIKLYFQSAKEISNEDYVGERVKKDMNDHPLSLAFSHQNFTEIGPSSPVHTDSNEIMNSEIQNYIRFYVLYFDGWIAKLVSEMEADGKLTSEGVESYVSSFGILDETSIFLLKRGIVHHFQRDYVASLHILIPQIETVLRQLLEYRNMSVFKDDKQAIMVRELGGLLGMQEIKEILGQDFHKYMQIKYVEVNGINLRNRLSHGLLRKDEFSHSHSFSVIYTILILLTMGRSQL
jgi:hypothetical protein